MIRWFFGGFWHRFLHFCGLNLGHVITFFDERGHVFIGHQCVGCHAISSPTHSIVCSACVGENGESQPPSVQ
jgi:hypothetical protein